MTIEQAQKEVRTVFMGGFPGQLASGALWLCSAAAATWLTPRHGILVIIVGGMLIFPTAQLLLKLMGRRAALSRENPMGQLATQIAFTIPLAYPLIAAAAMVRLSWFYPACMIVVGAHYLPFTFLYGMRIFVAWCALLVGGGILLGWYGPDSFTLPGWVTGAMLCGFALVGLALTRAEPAGGAATGAVRR